MRILGVSGMWPKLVHPEWTTFRFAWKNGFLHSVGDKVQVVYRPRSKKRKILGIAEIIGRQEKSFNFGAEGSRGITEGEARRDGFLCSWDMRKWLERTYGSRVYKEPLFKYTLKWECCANTLRGDYAVELALDEYHLMSEDTMGMLLKRGRQTG